MENEKYENLNLADDIFDHSDPETLQERSDEKREEVAEDSAKNQEIEDAEKDLRDDILSRDRAIDELSEATRWLKKMNDWVTRSEERLTELKDRLGLKRP